MARNAGKAFEREVQAALRYVGEVWPGFRWVRLHDGLQPIYDKRTQSIARMVPTDKTPADYVLAFPGGRIGWLECKHTDAPRLPLGTSGLKDHQRETIAEWWRAPWFHRTYLIWQCNQSAALLDGRELRDVLRKRKNAKSIRWEEANQPGFTTFPAACFGSGLLQALRNHTNPSAPPLDEAEAALAGGANNHE